MLVILLMVSAEMHPQAKSGLENYNLLDQGHQYTWMPVFHYETRKGDYAEIRYNYEALNTISVFGGRSISGGRSFQFNCTPMLGFSFGGFSGISLAANAEGEWNNLYISSQSQYSIAIRAVNSDFFFNWSELCYSIADRYFFGGAIQYTLGNGIHELDPGLVAGVNFKNISIPFYIFRPFSAKGYYILGVNFQYNIRGKMTK